MIRRRASIYKCYSTSSSSVNWLEKDCTSCLKQDKVNTTCDPEVVQRLLRSSHAATVLLRPSSCSSHMSGWVARNQARPSLIAPLLNCILSSSNSTSGFVESQASVGLYQAKAEYYNDQIRELFEHMPEQLELKEMLKTLRDEALEVAGKKPDNTVFVSASKALSSAVLSICKSY